MSDTFRKMMDLLSPRERRNFWLLMVLALVMGLFNMIGIASFLPFLSVLADPSVLEEEPRLAALYQFSGAARPLDFLLYLGIGVATLYVGGLAFKAGVTFLLVRFGAMRHHALAERMLARYLAQPYVWFLSRHSADMAKSVLAEVSQVVSGILIPMLNLMVNLVLVLMLVLLLVLVNPLIALFITGLIGGSYLAIYLKVRPRLAVLGEQRVVSNKARFKIAQEGLAGVKEVKVLGLERGLVRRFSDSAHTMARAQADTAVLREVPRHGLEALAFGGMMAVVLTLAFVNEGDLGAVLPVAGVYAVAGMRIIPAMQLVYANLNQLRFGRHALDTLHTDYVGAPSELPSRPDRAAPLKDRITLEDVTYAYPGADRPALDGLSMTIRANSSVGVVGGTGAGKTTAIDVVMGLLEPQSGRLAVDGRTVTGDEERRAWRRSIGYVPQQIFLVDASVSENIAFGVPPERIDHAAVERAARMAQIHAFVTEQMPHGYDTRVGDRGVRLSGGQRQRIGLARALYGDPDVLVLDEATSALDNVTERDVMQAVRELGGSKTIVMIAHRLTTVMDCDEIFLLQHGRVAASGAYDALLAESEAFRALAVGADRAAQEADG